LLVLKRLADVDEGNGLAGVEFGLHVLGAKFVGQRHF
jgi:hypothetical protein